MRFIAKSNKAFVSWSGGLKIPKTGIIILAHGTKLKKANNILVELIKTIKRKARWDIVEPAYLQFCEPNFLKSIKNVINKGCRRIIIVPFFLIKGNHVSRDIPQAIRKAKKMYPEVDFVYTKNLGDDKRISEIILDRIKEAME